MTRILVFGASITHGYWDFEGGGWCNRLRDTLDEYSWRNEDDYSIYNLGVSGHNSRDIEERIESEIRARDNGEDRVVLLNISGKNDSQVNLETGENSVSVDEYRENVLKLVDTAQRLAEEVVIITSMPMDDSRLDPIPWKTTHAYRTSERKKYRDALLEIVQDSDLKIVDVFPQLDPEEYRSKLRDGIHPDDEGHRQLYEIILQGLKEEKIIPEDV
jgi:lysophospholipase L1-like esterase